MEASSEHSGNSFEELFQNAPCGYVVTMLDGTILEVNHTFLSLTGYSHSIISQKTTFSELLTVSNKIYFDTHVMPLLQLQGFVNEVAFDIRCPDEKRLSVLINASIKDRISDGVKIILITIFNATDRRKYEHALLIARRDAESKTEVQSNAREVLEKLSIAKDNFLAVVSHELRTPLNAILGWTQMLLRGQHLEEKQREGLLIVERNARIQAQLIEDLLDLSRITSGKMRLDVQQVFLGEVVNAAVDTAKPAADAKELRIQKIVDPSVVVSGDPGRLQQVFWNLLTNAIKFTPKAGFIRIVMQRINSHVEVSVSDSGKGMTKEFLDRAFEQFSQSDSHDTRQTRGLGLGLSIVKNIVEMHGGSIVASSEGLNKGSLFVVSIPVAVVHESESERVFPRTAIYEKSLAPPDFALNEIKILVVDDQQDARELVRRVLSDSGAEVFTAASVQEALLLLERIRPNVLISDIGMPDEDGYEFLRRVRMLGGKAGRVPAIALTAFSRLDDRTQAMLAGFQRHLAKPIDARELILTVASILNKGKS